MKTKLLTLAATVILPFSAAQANTCEDDSRLYDLRPFIADIEAGKAVDDLMLTGHTYLSLNPGLRSTIGDNIKVYDIDCQAHAVVNGVPVTKVQAPFPELMNAYKNAFYSEESATIKLLAEGFKAAPLPDDLLFSLAEPMTQDRDFIAKLGAPLGLTLHGEAPAVNKGGTTKATLLDFFVRFDGVSMDPETYVYDVRGSHNGFNLEMMVFQPGFVKYFSLASGNIHNGYDVITNNPHLLNLFAHTGMRIIPVDGLSSGSSSNNEEIYRKAVRGR